MPLTLSFACPPYDRIVPLAYGRIVPEGIRLNYLSLEVEEIFWRQFRHREFDISEASLASYVMLRSRGDESFIAIPVFTSRIFRHSYVFINVHKGIDKPQDLKNKIVGVPEYQMTSVVWLRGIFQDEYGVYPADVRWRNGGLETPGRVEKIGLRLPPEIELESISPDKCLSEMLDKGELDALFTGRAPSCFVKGSPNVARLFKNYRQVEEQYYRKTGIFPIMHTIVIKREVYEKNPWIAMNLYKAFYKAKEIVTKTYASSGVFYVTLPWIDDDVARVSRFMDHDWWPYGVVRNRQVLETFLRYHHEQGLSERLVSINELFAAETLDEEYKI